MHRKQFIQASSILATTALFGRFQAFASTQQQQQQQLGVAVIGVNGMGWADLQAVLKIPQVHCVALCDVDENVLNRRVAELQQKGIAVAAYADHKDLLKDPNVDIVIIATPDHWHCLQFVDAIKANKHVYMEKPIGNSIRECERMLEVAEKSQMMVQVGQWQRSQQHFADAIDFVHSGRLGKIRSVKAWSYVDWKKTIAKVPDEAVPPGVDYERWLGPAKRRPFNRNRFHFEFRWFWDYAGGLMTDWGVHMLDYALLGMKVSTPNSVMALGGKYADPDGASETPDTLTTVYAFDDFSVVWEQAVGIGVGPFNRNHGVAFIGNKGTLVLNRDGWEVIPEKDQMAAVPLQRPKDNGLEKHMENFVAAIQKKDARLLNAPIQAGAHIAIFSQMGNIAYRTGQKLDWDKQRNRFLQKEANGYLLAPYHNGYRMT